MSTRPFDIKKLIALAWPIVLARATQSVVGFTDALMVSPLGEAPLAAVTTGALNTFSILVFPFGTVFIVQSFASQLRGRGELGAVRRYAWYGLMLAAFAGLLAVAVIPLVGPALGVFHYEPAVHRAMTTFVRIRLLSVGFAVGMEAIGNWYGGLGNTRVAMIGGLVTMVTNVFLNYALIRPRFGLPGYGVAGSAIANVIATAIGFAFMSIVFMRRVGVKDHPRDCGKPRVRELVRVLRFGMPNGMNWFLEFAAFALFFNVIVAHLGTTVLAAFNVVMQISSIAFMPAFGLASAGAIFVGEAIGRRTYDEVWPIVRGTGTIATLWMTGVGVIYALVPGRLLGLFQSHEASSQALVEVGTSMLMMAGLWQVFDGIGMTLSEALRAAGDTTWCMLARLVIAWLVWAPLAAFAVLVLGGGPRTVMGALVFYLALLATTFAWRFARGSWRSIQLVEPTLA